MEQITKTQNFGLFRSPVRTPNSCCLRPFTGSSLLCAEQSRPQRTMEVIALGEFQIVLGFKRNKGGVRGISAKPRFFERGKPE